MALAVEDIEKDEFLKKFINSTDNIGDHVADLLKSSDLSGQIDKLANTIGKLDQQIHLQVTKNHGDLLAQTENVELMEQVVKKCSSRSKQCQVDRLKLQVDRLHSELETEVVKVDNLYKTKQALRRIEEILVIFEKIDKQQNNLARVASNITQIEYICSIEPPLTFLKSYQQSATSLRQNIEKNTENMFNQGLNANSSAQVISSLQIFLNLNVLEQKIDKIIGECEKTIERDVKNALQVKLQTPMSEKGRGPGQVISPNQGGINIQIKNQIWTNLESLAIKLVASASKLKLLWFTLVQEKDFLTNYHFVEFIEREKWTKFWNNFLDILLRHFSSIQVEFIKITLEKEFPRLLQYFSALGQKLEDAKSYPGVKINIQNGLRGVVSNYEKAFLSKSLGKLFDSVNTVFAKGMCPSRRDIDSLLKLISNELTSIEDPMLKKLITRNISKTISLVCVKCEQLFVNDGSSTQVIGPATMQQTQNAAVLNLLEYIKQQQQQQSDIEGIQILMKNSITPLIEAISDAIEAILSTMHKEVFKRKGSSLYIEELQNFIARAAKEYLSLFDCNDLVQKCGKSLAARTTELFVRNVSLLISLRNDESTLNQIITDLNHLEIILTPLTPVLSEIGRHFKILRGFKTLLNLKLDEIKESNLIGNVVPYSVAIHLLISLFGEINQPYMSKGWSLTRYSKWLDNQTEEERLLFIRASIIEYHQSVTSSGKTEYAKVYPIIYDILQKGLNIKIM